MYYRYLIKPTEVRQYCEQSGMQVKQVIGSAPVINKTVFWKMLVTGEIEDDFEFQLVRYPLLGYIGMAQKFATP